MVVRVAVGLENALTRGKVIPLHVVVGGVFTVNIGQIKDRNRRQATIATHQEARLVGSGDRIDIANSARGHWVGIGVKSTSIGVDVEELRHRDGTRVQRSQAILNARVVVSPQAIFGLS